MLYFHDFFILCYDDSIEAHQQRRESLLTELDSLRIDQKNRYNIQKRIVFMYDRVLKMLHLLPVATRQRLTSFFKSVCY